MNTTKPSLLRSLFLMVALAAGVAMMNATPVVASGGGCDIVPALDFETGETVECSICYDDDGNCTSYACENDDHGSC